MDKNANKSWLLLGGMFALLVFSYYEDKPHSVYNSSTGKSHFSISEDECEEVTCTGHLAGYNWAGENSITDKKDCRNISRAFREGCEAFVDQIEAEDKEDAQRDAF